MTRYMEIITVPHPTLRKIAKNIERVDEKILGLASEMVKTLESDPRRGVGLAAPQVNSPVRLIIAKDGRENDSVTRILINPEIISASKEKETDYEGCLSLPGTYALVERNRRVVVKALNGKGQKITIKAAAFFARVLQHEIDHLDGILITDKAIGKILDEEEYHRLAAATTTE